MKIFYLTWSGHLGGAEIALLRLLRFLGSPHFEKEVWQLNPGPLSAVLEKEKIKNVSWSLGRLRNLLFHFSFHFRLAGELKKNKADILHANGTLAFLAGYLATRLCGVPMVWWLVDIPEGKDPNERLAARLHADMIICNSEATRDAFRRQYPGNSSPCEVVYPSIDLPEKSEDAAKLKEKILSLKGNPPVLLSAARFQRWKGQEVLVRSIPSVLQKFPEAVFVFAGDSLPGMEDGSRTQAEALAKTLGVEKNCRFLGFRNDVSDLMDLSDVVLHTSLQPEPFGLVIAEAMARGKAVIASDQGGPREIIDHQKNGWLISPGDSKILGAAIIHLLQDAPLRNALGSAARQKAQRYSSETIARQMEELYKKLLERRL